MGRYAIGVDYGSLSGRAVLVNPETGREMASAVYEYPHGVMAEALPDGTPLSHGWALQHPQDYLDVLAQTVPRVLQEAGVSPAEVVSIGIDCTASTVMPARGDGTPLCLLPEFAGRPHAYVKMWKHHTA